MSSAFDIHAMSTGVEDAPDHTPIGIVVSGVGKIKSRQLKRAKPQVDPHKLKNPEAVNTFNNIITQGAVHISEGADVSKHWDQLRLLIENATETAFVSKVSAQPRKPWITQDTFAKIKEAAQARNASIKLRRASADADGAGAIALDISSQYFSSRAKELQQQTYRRLVREDREAFLQDIAARAQSAADKGDTRELSRLQNLWPQEDLDLR